MSVPSEFEVNSWPSAIRDFRPEWGLVLGSGLGGFVEQLPIQHVLPFSEIPSLPHSTVPGHAGRFVFAEVSGKRVMIAQGRVHFYEGHTARAVTAGVRAMDALGVSRLILTNAAGTANPGFAPGGWMTLTDHLNLTGVSPLLGGPNFFDMTEVYSPHLRLAFAEAARAEDVTLHEGIYAGLIGPQYETPAEVRMFRQFGADAIGMSTVLEAIQARALGMEVAGCSCLTNWAAGLGDAALHHAEVLATGAAGAEKFERLLRRALALL